MAKGGCRGQFFNWPQEQDDGLQERAKWTDDLMH